MAVGFSPVRVEAGMGVSLLPSSLVLLLQAKWTWGPNGQGAVLLVNCDRDSPGTLGTDSGQADIRTTAGKVSPAV